MTLTSSPFGSWCIRILAGWAIFHGFTTIVQSDARWSAPIYHYISMIDASIWGFCWAVGGTLAMAASVSGPDLYLNKIVQYQRVKNAGLWLIAGTSFLYALLLWTTVIFYDHTVSLTGPDRDVVIIALCVMMTKAIEPQKASNVLTHKTILH